MRRAFTLLEVILALGLTVILIAAVTTAMRFQLFTLDASRGQLEESQLARAIMRKVSADIRGAVREAPMDFSEVSSLAEGTIAGGDTGDLAALAGAAGGTDALGDATGGDLDAESMDLSTLGDTTIPTAQPGLYGTQHALQIDVSRLPRIDEYQRYTVIDANGLARTEFPSDVKTVSYYVRPHESFGGATTTEEAADFVNTQLAIDPEREAFAGGLVRREVDRAVAIWRDENMPSDTQSQYEELLATEVVALQFRYFDGLEWLPEWDASVQQGLPRAIEIALVIDSTGVGETVTADLFADTVGDTIYGEADPTRSLSIYRQVVNLPLAAIPVEEEESLEGGSTDSSDDASSSSSDSDLEATGGGR